MHILSLKHFAEILVGHVDPEEPRLFGHFNPYIGLVNLPVGVVRT